MKRKRPDFYPASFLYKKTDHCKAAKLLHDMASLFCILQI